MPDLDDDAPLAEAPDDILVVAHPPSWQARLILAGIAAFCLAVVWAMLPPNVSGLGWGIAAYALVALVLAVGVILPFYAALSGVDLTWQLEPDGLRIVRRRPFWTWQRRLVAADIRRLGIVLAPGGGPERLQVTVTLTSGETLASASFDDPRDAEAFADALAAAFAIAAPASYLPPDIAPRRAGRRGGLGATPTMHGKSDIFH